MPTYRVTDPTTGKTVKLTGDSPPNEEELNQIFSSIPAEKPIPQEKGLIRRGAEAVINSPALPIAGAVAGGLAGSGLMSIPLAGLGAAGAEGYRQSAAHLMGMEAPRTVMPQLKEMGKQALIASAGEGAGQLVARGGAQLLAPLGKQVRNFFSAATGVPEYGFKALQEKPSLFLTATKKAVRKAGEKVGGLIDATTTKSMTPIEKNVFEVEQAFKTNAANRVAAKKVALKLASKVPASDAEIALANRSINKVINNTTDLSQKALLQEQKNVFQTELAERLPELKAANTEFSKTKAVSQFRNIGRLNKSGETSRLGAMLLSMTKNPAALATSPAVVGAALATGSALAKPVVGKTVAQITAQKFLTKQRAIEFLKQAKGDKAKAEELAKAKGYDTSRLADE